MHSKRLQNVLESTTQLSEHIRKRRSRVALNEFIEERINGTPKAIQPLYEDIQLNSIVKQQKQEELKTEIDSEQVIKTEEICFIPFPFIQSETLSYPDGRKIHTIFYPNALKIPAKIIEYSADGKTTKTTTYHKNGSKKHGFITIKNENGTTTEEKIDFTRVSKEVKTFNKFKIAIETKNYVNDILCYKMQCDDQGNILSEKTYYAFANRQVLKTETVYNRNNSYISQEFSFDGKLTGIETYIVKK